MKTVSTFKFGVQEVTVKAGPLESLDPIKMLVGPAKKDGVSFTNNGKCYWIVAFVGKVPLACVCALDMGKGHVRFKSDYVAPQARRMGLYRRLSKLRLDHCFEINFKQASCYAGSMSIDQFLRDGFEVVSEGKPEAKYLVKDLTNH